MLTAKKLSITAIFVALDVLANIFSIPIMGSNYISFTYLVCFAAAFYLGLTPALIVGALGDLIGCLIVPKGAFNPVIFMSSVLIAVIPALIFKIKGVNKYVKLVIALVICTVLVTAFLNTYALWLMYSKGKTFFVYLWARLPFQLLNTAVNGLLMFILMRIGIIDKLIQKYEINAKVGDSNVVVEDTNEKLDN
ncbi:MAG: folate family ECF transporter S component [Clostridia bacterium]